MLTQKMMIPLMVCTVAVTGWFAMEGMTSTAQAKAETTAKKKKVKVKGYYNKKTDTFVQTAPKSVVRVTTTYKAVAVDKYFSKYLGQVKARIAKMVKRGATKKEIHQAISEARQTLRKKKKGLQAHIGRSAAKAALVLGSMYK